VPLAVLGHSVTVVDPNADSLAAAQRRAAERDVRISAVQGEAAGLDGVVGEDAADLVICHSVLEYVDSPADALAAITRVLRSGGTVSVLASGQVAAVLHRALTGRFDEARALLEGDREAHPGTGPRWFTLPGLTGLIEGAGDLRRPDPQCAGGRRPGRGRVPACAGDGGRDVPRAARHRREAARPRAALRRPP
jgi:S-adenosylmethionine-dependent methyltransferase